MIYCSFMNKYANQYLKDIAAQLAIKSQIRNDRPVSNALGQMGGQLVSNTVTAPLTVASGGALMPLSALVNATAGNVGGRMATVGSGPEGRAQVEEAAQAVKGSTYGQLFKRQIKNNIVKNLALDTPMGAIAGGLLGLIMAQRNNLTGQELGKYIVGGAAAGGAATLGLTQLGNVASPGIRKLLAGYANDQAMQRGTNFIAKNPVSSSLPLNEFVAPVVAKEFQ
jgi:hypothetical protein